MSRLPIHNGSNAGSGGAFDVAYAALNAQQKTAVETIDGPLMVLAGPGTGKTQVVAMRVANILRKTHARPGNILCLTFSVSGATAMRERLRRIIGAEAYQIDVTTIHGFCNDCIQRHPEVFHALRLMEQVTDVERFRIVNAVIDALPLDGVLVNPKDPHARTASILSRISQCKREAVTPSDVARAADEYAVEMSTKSREGTKAHAENVRRAQQAGEFARIYAQYQDVLRERGLYDYDDMIHFAVAGMREHDWLLASLQERYQYILVDEYQDTSGAQHRVIETLTTLPESVGMPNLCVVGDDDQAIYRFQGASVEGMMSLKRRFPDCPVVVLTTSYRATQQILDAAGRLIAQNEDRVTRRIPDIDKTLVSGRTDPDGDVPSILRPPSDAVEPFAIADCVDRFLEEGTALSDIAVLTRTNAELFTIADVFRARGIPVQITGKLNLLHHHAVLQILAMLKGVAAPESNSALSDALGCASLGVHPADIARLWAFCRTHSRSMYDVLANIEHHVSDASLALHDPEALIRARNLLYGAHAERASLTLPELLERLIRQSGIVDQMRSEPMDVVAITEFFGHVKHRCYESQGFTLQTLLNDLDYRISYALPLQYAVPHLIDDAVQLMTAHASKGLEFEVVIVSNFREKHWDHRRPLPSLALPEHLLFSAMQQEGIEDERRLAYVAWTRAKRHLLIICPERVVRGDREQDVSPSAFAVEGGSLPESALALKQPESASALLLPVPPAIDGAMEAFLREKIANFELSVTALNHFLADPQRFVQDDLLVLPQAKNASQAYGTAVHEALCAWGRSVRDGLPLGDDALLASFRSAIGEREILVSAERERLQHLGEKDLLRFFQARLRSVPIIHAVEKSLHARLPAATIPDGVPIKGKIDRIDLDRPDGAVLRIIDYKTGSPKTEKQVREANNGDLYRQLVFYKMLVRHSPQTVGMRAEEFVLEFIGDRDEEPRTLTFAVSDGDVTALEKLVIAVWEKIQNLDFSNRNFSPAE